MRLIVISFLVLLMVGCASTVRLAEEGDTNTAIIIGIEVRESAYVWQQLSTQKVDGKRVTYALRGAAAYKSKAIVAAGEHEVEIRAEFNTGGMNVRNISGKVTFIAEPGLTYHPYIELQDAGVGLWIVEAASKAKVSEEIAPIKSDASSFVIVY